jgi:hypothetical protein
MEKALRAVCYIPVLTGKILLLHFTWGWDLSHQLFNQHYSLHLARFKIAYKLLDTVFQGASGQVEELPISNSELESGMAVWARRGCTPAPDHTFLLQRRKVGKKRRPCNSALSAGIRVTSQTRPDILSRLEQTRSLHRIPAGRS